MLIIKIEFDNGLVRSFSKIFTVNYEDKELLLNRSKFYFELYNSHYTELTPENLVIVYKIIPKRASRVLNVKYNYNVSHEMMLPSTMDLYLWSNGLKFNKNYSYAHYVKDGWEYSFEISKQSYVCTIQDVADNVVLHSFTDKLLSHNSELDCFTRIIGNKTFYFINGVRSPRYFMKKN
jgi:hypothetical protein